MHKFVSHNYVVKSKQTSIRNFKFDYTPVGIIEIKSSKAREVTCTAPADILTDI